MDNKNILVFHADKVIVKGRKRQSVFQKGLQTVKAVFRFGEQHDQKADPPSAGVKRWIYKLQISRELCTCMVMHRTQNSKSDSVSNRRKT